MQKFLQLYSLTFLFFFLPFLHITKGFFYNCRLHFSQLLWSKPEEEEDCDARKSSSQQRTNFYSLPLVSHWSLPFRPFIPSSFCRQSWDILRESNKNGKVEKLYMDSVWLCVCLGLGSSPRWSWLTGCGAQNDPPLFLLDSRRLTSNIQFDSSWEEPKQPN